MGHRYNYLYRCISTFWSKMTDKVIKLTVELEKSRSGDWAVVGSRVKSPPVSPRKTPRKVVSPKKTRAGGSPARPAKKAESPRREAPRSPRREDPNVLHIAEAAPEPVRKSYRDRVMDGQPRGSSPDIQRVTDGNGEKPAKKDDEASREERIAKAREFFAKPFSGDARKFVRKLLLFRVILESLPKDEKMNKEEHSLVVSALLSAHEYRRGPTNEDGWHSDDISDKRTAIEAIKYTIRAINREYGDASRYKPEEEDEMRAAHKDRGTRLHFFKRQ